MAVVNLPFYSPIVLSKALTTVDIVSNGRLDVGLGLGWAAQEFEAVGVSMEKRGARAEEFVELPQGDRGPQRGGGVPRPVLRRAADAGSSPSRSSSRTRRS